MSLRLYVGWIVGILFEVHVFRRVTMKQSSFSPKSDASEAVDGTADFIVVHLCTDEHNFATHPIGTVGGSISSTHYQQFICRISRPFRISLCA